jgi:hypothetical protein
MDCAGVASRLVAYHFATLIDEERDAIDAHLLACSTCLRAYLSLKRAAERGPLDRPSRETRARLRAEVEREFVKPPRVVFLQRKIPLYQGLVAAALAAAITLLVLGDAFRAAPVREGIPQVDTSRARAESLQIY